MPDKDRNNPRALGVLDLPANSGQPTMHSADEVSGLTLPGTEDWVQPGSLVRRRADGWVGRVQSVHPGEGRLRVGWNIGPPSSVDMSDVDQVLTDRTSRVHAEWWADARHGGNVNTAESFALGFARRGQEMSHEQIGTLIALCLRLLEDVNDCPECLETGECQECLNVY